MKRYSLLLSSEIFSEVKRVSNEEGVAVVDIFRRFVKMGIVLADELKKAPGSEIIIRQKDGKEKSLIFI
ncbi:MAG: hypothetical protein WCW14_02405 [Candidatus Paceibacterota bacterium]|jgi:hypothetical protein